MADNKKYLSSSELDELINKLRGTSDNLDTELFLLSKGEVEDLTPEQRNQLDNEIVRCDYCSWWYETHECEIDHLGLQQCGGCEMGEMDEYFDDEYDY